MTDGTTYQVPVPSNTSLIFCQTENACSLAFQLLSCFLIKFLDTIFLEKLKVFQVISEVLMASKCEDGWFFWHVAQRQFSEQLTPSSG